MHKRSQAASLLLLALVGCASEPNGSEPPTWFPIPGVSVAPWEQAHAICGPVLQQAAIAVRGGVRAAENAKAQFRACMGQNGWTDQAPKARNDARSAALDQDAEELLEAKHCSAWETNGRGTAVLGVGPLELRISGREGVDLGGRR
jgi:hypothetical protein